MSEGKTNGAGDRLHELFEKVRAVRDEARVQANLAKKDAEDEWKELEERWQKAKVERERVGKIVGDTAKGARSAAELALEELRKGYEKLRKG